MDGLMISLFINLNEQHLIMIKGKPIQNKHKNSTTRKPSLPIKRNSSVQSNISDQSCMSDRIVYKNKQLDQLSLQPVPANDSKKYQTSTSALADEDRDRDKDKDKDKSRMKAMITSDKSLKKIKSKLNIPQSETPKSQQQLLTGFQWLIIMRHCFHIENKRRMVNSIKQRTLINYLKNKMYPDSLWNKILVVENQSRFGVAHVVATIEKDAKWKLTLDDILVMVTRMYGTMVGQVSEDPESAAETARFTQNMKPILDHKGTVHETYITQPKFIYKSVERTKIYQKNQQENPKNTHANPNPQPKSKPKPVQPMNTTNINQFQIDQPQLALNISPISIIDQTNDISFSIEQSLQQSQHQSHFNSQTQFNPQYPITQTSHEDNQSHSQSQMGFNVDVDRFEEGFNGIQALKNNLETAGKSTEEKMLLVSFLEEVLSYSVYKNKESRNSQTSTRQAKKGLLKTSLNQSDCLQNTQYFHGLKLQTRKHIQKISTQILKRLFNSQQFIQYFHNLQAIKMCEYYKELPLTIPILSPTLRILNLSHNNLHHINFLKDLPLQHSLQFININNNKITNICELLSYPILEQIHVKNNSVDHVLVSKEKINAKLLRLIDLSNNQVQKEEDLWAVNYLPSLAMLNLTGNSILEGYKSKGVLSRDIITNHSEMYVFSAFTQYKDIAFTTTKNKEGGVATSFSTSSLQKIGSSFNK